MGIQRRIKYAFIIGWIVIVAGFLALVGWRLNVASLKGIISGSTPMNPVTAFTLVLSGSWLVIFHMFPKLKKPLSLISWFVIVVGGAHFFSYLSGVDSLRFDYLFFRDKIRNSGIPTLIAPNTALAFLLNGVAMLFTSSHRRTYQLIRQALIIISFSLVYISLLGYVYDVKSAYKDEHFTPMALYTALIFLLLNTGLLLSNTHFGLAKTLISPFTGGNLIRRASPFILAVPLLTGYLRIVGERNGLFSMAYGMGLHTLVFTLAMLIFVSLYAALENNRQMLKMRTEKQLEVSEKRFRVLFNTLKEGVASINLTGRLLYSNPALANITGYAEAELAGKNVIDLFIPTTERAAFYKKIGEQATEAHEHYETEIIKKDGEKIWVSLQLTPILNTANEVEAMLVTATDITQERLKIQDLQAFSASAAHDLHAPLARISMVMNVFETDNLTEDQKMFLTAIDDTSRAMRLLLQDLLSFSKLGAEQLEKTPLDILALATEVCRLETPENYKGEIIINALPQVNGNETAIRQLYTNLVSNAIKYSANKDHPRIEIGAYKNRKRTVYYVTDNGTGLTAQQISELFTPFKRFHTNIPGNGMGLPIVKRIIEKHGGRIWVDSVAGEGVTFCFTLSPDIQITGTKNRGNTIK